MTQRKGQVKVLSIKKFADICHTTPRTLRFYEQKGLISPYAIDPMTKYRSYDARQAREFLRIKLLQNYGIPLGELQILVKTQQLDNKLEEQLAKVKENILEKQREYTFLNTMKSFLFEKDMENIFKREVFPPKELFCMRFAEADYNDMATYQKTILDKAKQLGLTTGKEQYTFYLTTRYEPKATSIELGLPILKTNKNTLKFDTIFSMRKLPKIVALVYEYSGPYEYFSVVYQKLFNYIELHEIQLSGDVFDVYPLSYKKSSKYEMKAKLVFPIK